MATKVKLIADNVITTSQIDTSSLDSHFTGGTGVTYSSGTISIGQAVATTDNVTFADLTVTGDLNITGDINSYNVTDLDVTDKTITLGAGQIEANSDGSGIIIDGSLASILWDETNTEFDINNSINVTGTVIADDLHIDSTSGQLKISRVGSSVTGIYWDRLGTQDAAIQVADNEHLNIDNNFGNPINLRIGADASETTYLSVSTSGIAVTGTVTSDGLTLNNEGDEIKLKSSSSQVSGLLKTGDTVSTNALEISNGNAVVLISDTNDSQVTGGADATLIARGSSATKTALFDVNGDISFYEDTGTDAKFFWDASEERLGIGTTTPSALLHVAGDARIGAAGATSQLMGQVSSGGIFEITTSSAVGKIHLARDVVVGTTEINPTSSGVNTAGLSFSTTGGIRSTVASNPAATFNRKTDNGSVVIIRKDGNTLGVLGTEGGDAFYVGSGDTGLKFSDGANAIQPFNTNTVATTNNTIDLGTSGAVFSNLWVEKIKISGNSNDEGIYFSSNHRIYGGSNRAFEASTSSGGSVQIGEGYTTGDVFISAPTLLYPETQAYKSDTGIQRYTKTVSVGESATTVLTVTKTSYLYGIAGTITIILFDTASPWGIYMRKFTIAGRKSTHQAGDNMGYTTGTPENIDQMDYTPTFADSDSRTSGQSGGTITFTVANGSGKGTSGGKIIFDGYISGATLS